MLSDVRSQSEFRSPNHDTRLLFVTRFTRLFAYGALSVVLVFYLSGIGLSESRIGMLLTLILLGDTVVSLILTTQADRIGRRRMLIIGSFLMTGAGLAFALTSNFLFLVFARLSSATEVGASEDGLSGFGDNKTLLGIGHSREIVLKLSGLFALDSFGGGFVVQSFAAYWFYFRFRVKPAALGAIFFGANIFAGVSALLASRLASRFGLVKTMVFTHLPSNILLILLPLMPTLRLAIGVLLLRFSISQMDVPTRQSYTMAVVHPAERSAAAGITGVARTIAASIPPMFVGLMFANPRLINVPFFIAGSLKIAYDLLLYRQFVAIQPPEEDFR